jgi:hypothetical protein
MLRRFNYTGRKKIAQDDVPVALQGTGASRTFDANLTAVADAKYSLPKDARIFVEAYERTAYMRFNFGTVGYLTPPSPESRLLTEFGDSAAVRFRVKVVHAGNDGQLLAVADGILPLATDETEQNKLPLLPVRSEDLGQEVWRIEFDQGPQNRPVLLINSNAGDKTAIVWSPAFVSLAWPALLREILTRILFVEEDFDLEDEEDWRAMWIQFGRTLLPTHEAPPVDEDDRAEWLSSVVEAFCNRYSPLAKFKESEEEANVGT